MKSANDVLLCDFCGNSQHVAKLLVRGIADAAICDDCIATCGEIVAEARAQTEDRTPSTVDAAKAWVAKAIRKRP
ncbi:ClpX C4-type zinc finger protein [Paraburkholderia sp. CNPSo 3076]|jgi:ATP-dependent protease Clp ATPase subunit|uniref:ClpX C4-type zinc finger protein n=1 Tax=Paraburkholderia sp. CNPSo 3076 TaxID=2940936 RepID=UPI003A5216E1